MNHRKLKRGVKLGKGRNSMKMFQMTTRRIKRRRRPNRYIKPNHWHQAGDLAFSKIILRDVERLWLELNAPTATITYEKVHNCESMPLFKSGEWNGYAYFVRFTKETYNDSIMFRINWYNNRA